MNKQSEFFPPNTLMNITTENDLCFTAPEKIKNGTNLLVDKCTNSNKQKFYVDEFGRIKHNKFCLSLYGGNTTNTTPIIFWDCASVPVNTQQWNFPDRLIQSQKEDKCIYVPSNKPGNEVRLWDCINDDKHTFAYRNIGGKVNNDKDNEELKTIKWIIPIGILFFLIVIFVITLIILIIRKK